MNSKGRHDRADLKKIARQAMEDKGLEPDFSREALGELGTIHGPAPVGGPGIRDLRGRLWASIDNDDSRDLDQRIGTLIPCRKRDGGRRGRGVRAVGGCGTLPHPREAPGVANSSSVVRAGAGSRDRQARMAGVQTGVRPGAGPGARAGSGRQGEVGTGPVVSVAVRGFGTDRGCYCSP